MTNRFAEIGDLMKFRQKDLDLRERAKEGVSGRQRSCRKRQIWQFDKILPERLRFEGASERGVIRKVAKLTKMANLAKSRQIRHFRHFCHFCQINHFRCTHPIRSSTQINIWRNFVKSVSVSPNKFTTFVVPTL